MKRLDKNNIEDILSLTPVQEGMLFHYLKDPESEHYFEQLCLGITGKVDVELFEKAWNFVIGNNEMLRTVFRWEKVEHPIQIILKEHRIQPGYYDYSAKEISERQKKLEKLKTTDKKNKFDLQEVPFRVTLCKVETNQYEMIISNHHILYDGWSNGIILKEFFNAYNDLSDGKELLSSAKTSFREFVKWNRDRDLDKQEKFWRDYLKGFDTAAGLTIKGKKEKKSLFTGTHRVSFSRDLTGKIENFVKNHKITLAAFIYSAWGILLQRYCNSADVIFGTTVSGRSAPIKGIEDMVGLFINTVPLRVKTGTGEKIKDLLYKINNILPLREIHENTPLVDIKGYSELKNNEALFDSIVVLENYPLDSRLKQQNRSKQLSIDYFSWFEMTNYDLTVTLSISDSIEVNYIYKKELFDKEAVVRLSNHFTYILHQAGNGNRVEKEIHKFDILSEAEKRELLFDFNDTGQAYAKEKTIHELFEEQVDKTPDNIGVIAQSAEERHTPCTMSHAITYRELNKKSNQLAHFLKEKCVGPDTIVGIMVERTIEMIIGIFGILKAGGAYLPIDPKYPPERIDFMLKDSSTKFLLVDTESQVKVKSEAAERFIEITDIDISNLSLSSPLTSPSVSTCQVGPANLAYVIYTSGSTGKSKGVLVQHGSVVNILLALFKKYPLLMQDAYLLKTSFTFDVSVSELFGWYLGGGRLAILERGGEKDPLTILDWIERIGITHINFVPSMFAVFLEILDPRKVSQLSNLKYIFLAGEALTPHMVTRFNQFNTGIILENIYGPTESTIYASQYSLLSWDGMGSIPIGKPLSNTRLYILNPNDQLQPIGVSGELLIGGEGLARGYLNRPGLTAEKFDHDLWDYQDYHDEKKNYKKTTNRKLQITPPLGHQLTRIRITPNKKFLQGGSGGAVFSKSAPPGRRRQTLYKTGDLARWQADGSLEFLGRMDQQVKIRGNRIELGEIESELLDRDEIREAVVTVRADKNGDKYLCAYIIADMKVTPGVLREFLSEKLPGYMIPSYFVSLDKMPLTQSGKLDRRRLPPPEAISGEKYVAPRDEIEEKMVELWSQILGIEKDKIGIDAGFFELGGHSLKATTLVSRIHKEFDAKVSLGKILEIPTIRRLAVHIKEVKQTVEDKYVSIEAAEKKDIYPLSSAQRRLYILQRMDERGISYNMPSTWVPGDDIDTDRVTNAFKQLIRRHESLRTSFEVVNDEPVQRIHKEVKFGIEYLYLEEGGKEGEVLRAFVRTFDLARAPLLRVGLIQIKKEKEPLLMVDMHHIISDGASTDLLVREFIRLYNGEELPPLRVQYKDFSRWQNSKKEQESIRRQERYWLKEFAGEIPVLNLPVDSPMSAIQDFSGRSLAFEIGKEETQKLKNLALTEGATLYMVLLAIFNVLLARLSGQEEIIVGSPAAGRRHPDLEQIIGMFVNTLALKNYPSGEKTIKELIAEVKKKTLEAQENQEYPFEDLVENVRPERDASRNPLFDVMFVLRDIDIDGLLIPGLKLKPYPFDSGISKFDMTLSCQEVKEHLYCSIEYCTSLFKEETIKRMIQYFKKIIMVVLGNSDIRISDMEIVPVEEKKQLVFDFNDTETAYPGDKTIPELFEQQLERTPDHAAVSVKDKQLTYRELKKNADGLAQLLRNRGIKPDNIVGIIVKRSLEMVVGIMGILKAGGAYLPIEPEYPVERILFMLENSESKMLLTPQKYTQTIAFPGETMEVPLGMCDCGSGNLEHINNPENLLYLIYTSGSTGKPKGVMVKIKGFINLIDWYTKEFGIDESDNILLTASFSFDLAQKNLFAPLIKGARFCLPFFGLHQYDRLSDLIEKEQITMINCAPSVFYPLVELNRDSDFIKLKSLKEVFLGGESIQPDKLLPWINSKSCAGEIVNTYGPTECTDIASFCRVSKEELNRQQNIPIGKPIHNVRLYVLDKNRLVLPVGITGELFIGGIGLAKGYYDNKQLTDEKYINVPHLPEEKIYRTGDLTRWLPDGNIQLLGRIDHQVKIRGLRIELGEIESQLRGHDQIKDAVVLAREDKKREKYLCAYLVPGEELDVPALRAYLSGSLPDFMIPSYFVMLDRIPLTPNGKTDRRALPEPDLKAVSGYIAPRNQVEEKLVELWSEVLEVEKKLIGIDNNFFELGGHSLKVNSLLMKIHRIFDVKLPMAEVFKTPKIREMAKYINTLTKNRYETINPVEKKDYYQVSSTQKRLYILQQMESGHTTGYNMPYVIPLKKEIHKEKLESAFGKLIARHESLRTSFELVSGEPVQRIHDSVYFAIHDFGLEKENKKVEEIIANFEKPFDLCRAPLLRVGLMKLPYPTARQGCPSLAAPDIHRKENPGNRYVLLVDMHHIITDDASQNILQRELWALAAGQELGTPRLHYKDFSRWQHSQAAKALIKQQDTFWREQFSHDDQVPVLNLPTDFPRPSVKSFEGSSVRFVFTPQETRALRDMAREIDATLFMCILAIYTILLSKLSGHEDIVIGIPTAARRHADMEHIIGMFANTLVMRNYPSGEKTFKIFLQEVKERTLKAFENQEYPFEELVEKVSLRRDISRNPIFDVMFNLLNQLDLDDAVDMPGVDDPGGNNYEHRKRTAKFDLNLTAVDDNGKNLYFDLEYCTRLFKASTIERMIEYFRGIVASLSVNTGRKISELEIITTGEKARILEMSNGTEEAVDIDQTIHGWFEEQAERTPDHVALVEQIPSPASQILNPTSITYRELERKTRRLALKFQQKGVRPGTIVGIITDRSLEMVTGIFGILRAGGAYLPLDPGYPGERIDYILADSGAKMLVSADEIKNGISASNADLTSKLRRVKPGSPAYVIYTSGSTGKPKGVMIQHGSAVNLLLALQKEYRFGKKDAYLLKTAYVFDVSVTELFGWYMGGGKAIILQKEGEKSPRVILDSIERNCVSHINFVPSMFNVFLEELSIENINRLASLKYIFLAGEALLPELVKKFRRLNLPIALENIYGPTECTVYASNYSLSAWRGNGSVPIGKPLPNLRLYIIGKDNRLQPVDVPGELCISGIGVGRGYLNRPELTAEKFDRDLWAHLDSHDFQKKETWKKAPGKKDYRLYKSYVCYRTGDLARWQPDGNIEFLGRIDYQVKIRGFRVELGEIENRLLRTGGVKEAVALALEENRGDKYICAYFVSDREYGISELRDYLSKELPDYMIPSYFVRLEKIPLTSNGKVDRKALPEPGKAAAESYIALRDEVEKKLVEIWSDVLGVEKAKIGIDTNFFDLGGHSLKGTVMVSKIHKEFNVIVSLAEIFKAPKINALARYLKAKNRESYMSIDVVEKKEYYAVSSSQERLYVLRQMDETGIGYNMPSVWQLEGDFDEEKFEAVFHQLIRRHESLRTSFHMVNEKPVQRIMEEVEFKVEVKEQATDHRKQDTADKPATYSSSADVIRHRDISSEFIRPFDLSKAPLLRVGLIKLPHTPAALQGQPSQEGKEYRYLLMVDMHHIISDGMSAGIFIKEFIELYAGKKPAVLRLQYKDYSQWHNRQTLEKTVKRQEAYWLKEFSGEIPVLDLPTDYPRPPVQDFAGSSILFEMDREETNALKSLANKQGVTLFMLLISLYTACLSRLCGQEEIVVGTPIAGRRHADLESLIGMFVNTLALRHFPAGPKPFIQFLTEVKENTIKAFENQDYLYEDLVQLVDPGRDTSRNPLFDTMFTLHNFDALKIGIPGLKVKPIDYETSISKFDLSLDVVETDKLYFTVEYCTKLFKEKTIRRFISCFRQTVYSIINDNRQKISGIKIIPEAEKEKILFDFNNTKKSIERDKSFHDLFEGQAGKSADKIAAVSNDYQITYNELNEEANRVAHFLREHKVTGNTIVALYLKRSINMLTSIVGVFKAGGAYLPVDVDYPANRIEYMLKDSDAKVVITEAEYSGIVDNIRGSSTVPPQVLYMDRKQRVEKILKDYPGKNPGIARRPEDLVYMIYTSGTTGKPKGVMIHQLGMINHLYAKIDDLAIEARDIIAQTASACFDISVWQFLAGLVVGGTVVIIDKEIVLQPGDFLRVLQKTNITILESVPSLMSAFLEITKDERNNQLKQLRWMVPTGEALSVSLVREWYKYYPHIKLVNAYGPTESSDDVTHYLVEKVPPANQRSIPIGKPLQNLHLYILDKYLSLCPIGVRGEICVAGIGVGKGYWKDIQKTSKVFIPNPFLDEIGDRDFALLYKTGDIGYFKEDGNIEYLGRLDHQLKIRGNRLELGEIQRQILSYNDIKEAVVTVKEDETGNKFLCAYIVPHSSSAFNISGLREYLLGELPDYMVPSFLIPLQDLPLTPSGKIDRKALPGPESQVGENITAPHSEVEKKLVKIFSEILGMNEEAIGLESNFFQLGGHSLKAVLLAARIHKLLEVNIPLASLFKTPTIGGLAEYIQGAGQDGYVFIEPAVKKKYYELSSAQQRLYFLQQMEPHSTVYNLLHEVLLREKTDFKKLERIFAKMIERHESLRTSFELVRDKPVQKIHDTVEFRIDYYDMEPGTDRDAPVGSSLHQASMDHVDKIIRNFLRPFDLSRAPLFRAAVVKAAKERDSRYILILCIHHIITDGVSNEMLIRDFLGLLKGETLPPLRLQYKDFSEWQNNWLLSGAMNRQESYWLSRFKDGVPDLALPTDYPRPRVQNFAGASISFEIDKALTGQIREVGLKFDTTLYVVLMAAYNILLAKYTGQADIVVGTSAAGRRHADLENIIGMFVNMLPLRNEVEENKTFPEFLNQLKQNTLDALENQDYPFAELVKKLGMQGVYDRNPIFDTAFVLQNAGEERTGNKDLEFIPSQLNDKVSRFDITFLTFETRDSLKVEIEYSTTLFKPSTINGMAEHYIEILNQVVNRPDIEIKNITLAYELQEAQSKSKEEEYVNFGF